MPQSQLLRLTASNSKAVASISQSTPVNGVQNHAPPAISPNSDESFAKAWIAARESGGSYTARNSQFIGKYQLSSDYLNGDYSAANQERVADKYVENRYGSWQGTQSF